MCFCAANSLIMDTQLYKEFVMRALNDEDFFTYNSIDDIPDARTDSITIQTILRKGKNLPDDYINELISNDQKFFTSRSLIDHLKDRHVDTIIEKRALELAADGFKYGKISLPRFKRVIKETKASKGQFKQAFESVFSTPMIPLSELMNIYQVSEESLFDDELIAMTAELLPVNKLVMLTYKRDISPELIALVLPRLAMSLQENTWEGRMGAILTFITAKISPFSDNKSARKTMRRLKTFIENDTIQMGDKRKKEALKLITWWLDPEDFYRDRSGHDSAYVLLAEMLWEKENKGLWSPIDFDNPPTKNIEQLEKWVEVFSAWNQKPEFEGKVWPGVILGAIAYAEVESYPQNRAGSLADLISLRCKFNLHEAFEFYPNLMVDTMHIKSHLQSEVMGDEELALFMPVTTLPRLAPQSKILALMRKATNNQPWISEPFLKTYSGNFHSFFKMLAEISK